MPSSPLMPRRYSSDPNGRVSRQLSWLGPPGRFSRRPRGQTRRPAMLRQMNSASAMIARMTRIVSSTCNPLRSGKRYRRDVPWKFLSHAGANEDRVPPVPSGGAAVVPPRKLVR
jgi:hypothetical protein